MTQCHHAVVPGRHCGPETHEPHEDTTVGAARVGSEGNGDAGGEGSTERSREDVAIWYELSNRWLLTPLHYDCRELLAPICVQQCHSATRPSCLSVMHCQLHVRVRVHVNVSVSTACHELRNPLHAIMATLGFMMEDATMTAEQASDVNIIYLSASHMQRLVNDVLDLAKLREGTLKICPELVRLRLLTALISYPPANQRIIDELTSYDHIDALPAFLL